MYVYSMSVNWARNVLKIWYLCFCSHLQLDCPTVVAAIFICGIGGTFQYGFCVSVMTSPSVVSRTSHRYKHSGWIWKNIHFLLLVYKKADQQNLRGTLWLLLRGVAGLSHMVLHCLHLLHWGVTGVANSWLLDIEIWQVGEKKQFNSLTCGTVKETKVFFSTESDAFCWII